MNKTESRRIALEAKKPSMLFLIVPVAIIVFVIFICSGCATVKKYGPTVIHAWFDLSGTNKVQAAEKPVDAVPFDSLVWSYGGFKPASATVIKGNIASVAFNGRMLTYSGTLDADWGSEGNAPSATICAIFFKESDGIWRGGKFDWVGSLGKPRPAGHIAEYSGWNHPFPAPKGEEYAFVLIRGDNRKSRTNVIKGTVK